MAFHVFLLAGGFFSLNLIEITNPGCNNELDCSNNELRSCCEGICNAWKYCNGTCVTDTDCDFHELCVDKMCTVSPNKTKNSTKKPSHIKLKDYLICIGFVMGLFLFQLGLPLLYIYKDKVAFCLKCKWLWNKENIGGEEGAPSPQQMSRRWPLFGWSLAYPTPVHYSRLSQLDDSCSFESELYTESRNPEQNLEIVQRQVENVFGVPPPIYTNQTVAGEVTPDTSENISPSDPQAENSDQSDEPHLTDAETEEIVHSESNVNDSSRSQEMTNMEEVNLTSRAEQHFNLALSIPPPYERARFSPPDDDQTHETGFYSPANELPDDLSVESSLKKLYRLPSYNSINKISEEAERFPPSYTDALED